MFNQLPFPPGDKRYISRAIYYQPKSDKDSIKLIFPINISDVSIKYYLKYNICRHLLIFVEHRAKIAPGYTIIAPTMKSIVLIVKFAKK